MQLLFVDTKTTGTLVKVLLNWPQMYYQHFNRAYLVTIFTSAHEKVVRFDVSMNEIFIVEIFNATDHLEKEIIFWLEET